MSSEYIKSSKAEAGDVDEETAKFDADRAVNSKYFVNQILQQGEEGLRDAWSKVRCSSNFQHVYCCAVLIHLLFTASYSTEHCAYITLLFCWSTDNVPTMPCSPRLPGHC